MQKKRLAGRLCSPEKEESMRKKLKITLSLFPCYKTVFRESLDRFSRFCYSAYKNRQIFEIPAVPVSYPRLL